VITTDPVGSAPKKSTVSLIISTGAEQVKVPGVVGQSKDAATVVLKAAGFEVESTNKSLPAGDPNDGNVITQDPAAGQTAEQGSVVHITIGIASASPTSTSPTTTGAPTTTGP